ncbi:AMP-dependent synthetase/ligase [soil metagenome]
MLSNQNILVGRFWQHVFTKQDACAVLLKNPITKSEIITTAVSPMGGGGVVVVTPRPYVELPWRQVGEIVAEMIVTLQKNGVKRGDRVAILSWNCPEWVWTDIAIQTLGAVAVPIYPNSASEAVNYIVNDCGATLLIGDDNNQTKKVDDSGPVKTLLFSDLAGGSETYQRRVKGVEAKGINADYPEFEKIKVSDAAKEVLDFLHSGTAAGTFAGTGSTDPTIAFAEVVANGDQSHGIRMADICTMIYTSGSTGQPKGVALTNANITASCQGVHDHGFDFNESDVYLSYLPLAHCYERINGQYICLWNAVPTAFCKVEEVGKVVKIIRPTILLGVPQVWRKIKEKIEGEIAGAKGFKAKLIKWAFKQESGFAHWVADKLVFRTIRAGLGGRLRIMGSGGAAISAEVIAFYKSIGLSIIQGYGLTETCGAIAANSPGFNKAGTVGKVIPGVEIKFVALPGAAADAKGGIIYLKGGPVCASYWNLPEDSAKSFDGDGWFNTGDIGHLDEDECLVITGRAKRLFKTEGGKYVAPEKVEKAFDGSAIIQAIVPVGNDRPFIGALIFINTLAAKELLRAGGVSTPAGASADDAQAFIANHQLVKDAVKAAIAEGNTRLEHWETVKKVEIISDEATVANGLLTATLKIRSEEAMKRYADRIDAIYVKPGK